MAGEFSSAAILSFAMPASLRLLFKGTYLKERIIGNGGWHFSFLTDLEGVKKKLDATAHQESNNPYFKSMIDIDKIIKNRQDFFGREGYVWDIVNDNDLPKWLLANKSSMSHLFYEEKVNDA